MSRTWRFGCGFNLSRLFPFRCIQWNSSGDRHRLGRDGQFDCRGLSCSRRCGRLRLGLFRFNRFSCLWRIFLLLWFLSRLCRIRLRSGRRNWFRCFSWGLWSENSPISFHFKYSFFDFLITRKDTWGFFQEILSARIQPDSHKSKSFSSKKFFGVSSFITQLC